MQAMQAMQALPTDAGHNSGSLDAGLGDIAMEAADRAGRMGGGVGEAVQKGPVLRSVAGEEEVVV